MAHESLCQHAANITANETRELFQEPLLRTRLRELYRTPTCAGSEVGFSVRHAVGKSGVQGAAGLCICVNCGQTRCGRFEQQHALQHANIKRHPLAMNLVQLNFYCYACNRDLEENEIGHALEFVRSAIPVPNEENGTSSSKGVIDSPRSAADSHSDGDKSPEVSALNQSVEFYLRNQKGGLAGLSNLGNSCFFNSTLQCLMHLPPFIQTLVKVDVDSNTPEGRITDELSKLVRRMWSGVFATIAPRDLLQSFIAVNPIYRGYGQQCAHEFLRFLLTNIHDATKTVYTYNYNPMQITGVQSLHQSKKSFSPIGKRNGSGSSKPKFESSPVLEIFQGLMRSTVVCSVCKGVSVTVEPFADLSLEIPKNHQIKKAIAERGNSADMPHIKSGIANTVLRWFGADEPPLTLAACMHAFCTSDGLRDHDQYKCETCQRKVDATKTMAIELLPPILCIHSKRFSYQGYGSKISRTVSFPAKDFDMTPFLARHNGAVSQNAEAHHLNGINSNDGRAASNPDNLYDLYGIVRHIGAFGSGHYVAYSRSHVNDSWWEFDDRIVKEVSEEKVLSSEAYILFYRRHQNKGEVLSLVQRIEQAHVHSETISPDTVLISRHWLRKMQKTGYIEPIDNRDLCCPHGVEHNFLPDGGDVAMRIPEALFISLQQLYGGGPKVYGWPHTDKCEACELPRIREMEKERISRIDTLTTQQEKPDDYFWLIESHWLESWRKFVLENGERPGPISNHLFFDKNGLLRGDLQKGTHYRGLHGPVWKELRALYGGGPAFARAHLNIYEPPAVITEDDIPDLLQ